MTLKTVAIAAAVIALAFWAGRLNGWYAYAVKINADVQARKQRTEVSVQTVENKAATANVQAKVIYRTVYRDVVKYVNDPNRTKDLFDPAVVELRQRAINAANDIPGFDEPAVQIK